MKSIDLKGLKKANLKGANLNKNVYLTDKDFILSPNQRGRISGINPDFEKKALQAIDFLGYKVIETVHQDNFWQIDYINQ